MSNTYTTLAANELCQMLAEIARAKHRCELLKEQPYVIGKTKHFLQVSILNRINLIEKDMLAILGDSGRKAMKEAVLEIEGSAQLAIFQTAFLMLNDESKAHVEEFIVSLAKQQSPNESEG